MKQLTVFEMEEISGGYSWDFSSLGSALTSIVSNGAELTLSALLGGAVYAMTGSVIGGAHGGNGGGSLGFGTLGMMVGGLGTVSGCDRWCDYRRHARVGQNCGTDHGIAGRLE